MQFYTYAYIVQRSQISDAVQYALSFLALAALLFVIFKYLCSRFVSRYRDLIVILLLTVLFLGGVQYRAIRRRGAIGSRHRAWRCSCTASRMISASR